uniref:Myb-like domain-containing protein n=1 Tax=Sipha flava TaxID=143950 RepID=A0A2S2QEI9_9HEMI
MDTYYVCNGNLVKNDTQIDPKDIFIIEEPFETYDNNSNPDESIQLENDILLESRKRNCREWSQYETKILMDMYRRNVTQVGPMKKFKSKREMFKYIAQIISTKLNIIRSAHQCENRYKTVVNQLKVGPTIVQKAKSDVGNNEEESQERSQSDVTASVSADHDYNGQNSRINGQCPNKSISEWGIDDTKLLMELYRKNISKVGLERTFRTKLKMFEHIATVISDILNITRTAEQCLNRYKTIFRRKSFKQNKIKNNNLSMNNTIIENNLNSNDSPDCDTHLVNNFSETEFNTHIYDGNTLRKIVRQPKIMPKIISTEHNMNPETLLVKTLKDIAAQKEKTLLKIAANQECAHERRHQEQLALIRYYGNIKHNIIHNILRVIFILK